MVRMAIDNEMAIGRLLVLADASLDQRRVLQGREAKSNILANVAQNLGRHYPFPRSRIELGATRIIGDLEPAPSAARNPVKKLSAMVAPHRHMTFAEAIVSSRGAKKENLLLGSLH